MRWIQKREILSLLQRWNESEREKRNLCWKRGFLEMIHQLVRQSVTGCFSRHHLLLADWQREERERGQRRANSWQNHSLGIRIMHTAQQRDIPEYLVL